MDDRKQLFTIGKVCEATGMSRSGVIKLEQEGLIRPAVWEGPGKNRYYTIGDVETILRIRAVMRCGFTHAEVKVMLEQGNDYNAALGQMEKRFSDMERLLLCLRIMCGKTDPWEVREQSIPALCCYCEPCRAPVFRPETLGPMEKTLENAVAAGEPINHFVPWFYALPSEKMLSGVLPDPDEVRCCIPLFRFTGKKNEAGFDESHVFSITVRENSKDIPEKIRKLKEALLTGGYVPDDECRIFPLSKGQIDAGEKDGDAVIVIVLPAKKAQGS